MSVDIDIIADEIRERLSQGWTYTIARRGRGFSVLARLPQGGPPLFPVLLSDFEIEGLAEVIAAERAA